MARLDRLGPAAREVAQVGAAIGREFDHELLAAVADRDEAALAAALDQLVGAGLVFRRGVPPEASYLFKHALVQDAAYGSSCATGGGGCTAGSRTPWRSGRPGWPGRRRS